MCFDKTGTLTEDSLDMYGVRAVDQKSKRYSPITQDEITEKLNVVEKENEKNSQHKLLELMACCHALTHIQGAL